MKKTLLVMYGITIHTRIYKNIPMGPVTNQFT